MNITRLKRFPRLLITITVPMAVMAFLWLTRSNEITLAQGACSLALLFLPWQAYLTWQRKGRPELPLFAMLSVMFALYYVVPLFWGELSISAQFAPLGRDVPNEAITSALLLALLGVIALRLGLKVGIGRKLSLRHLDLVRLKPGRMNYVRLVLALGTLVGFFDNAAYVFGQSGRQAGILLISTIPLLAFAILFRSYLRKTATRLDRALILMFLGARFLSGMSSGWLGVFTSLLIICASLYIAEHKKLPRVALLLVVCFTLFFQVGKDDFRRAYWKGEEQATGRVQRLLFWVENSYVRWSEAIDDPTGETLKDALSPSVNRLSLLTQTANVIDQTPSVVPYQYGELYSYMFVTLVPRIVWPDKPSASEANQYYQVVYGLTPEENLETVSISVGVLTEGYISFGWLGALGIMFLLGLFFDFFQTTFLSRTSGQLLTSLGIVILPQFLTVETQLAQYLGGVIQQVVFTLIIMLPAMNLHRRVKPMPVGRWQYANK